MKNQILTNEKINEILGLAQQKYYDGIINMDVEQALIIMLKITHHFKFELDCQKESYSNPNERLNRIIEQFKIDPEITNRKDELKWIRKNGALENHIRIQDLLLHILYDINGTHYRHRDRDYDWEDELEKIFVDMQYGREFDQAMIHFLLLPLYNSTHGTKYIIQDDLTMSDG